MQYVAIIEWDGKPPSGLYYHRMHDLGLFVRAKDGDKSQSPLVRRASETREGAGVIVQEGCVLCASFSLARTVAGYAVEEGAKCVMIGSAGSLEPFEMTPQDVKVLQQIDSVLGKKGRPTGEKFDIVLTCLEEGVTFQYDEISDRLVNCPNCHGTMIRKRPGRMHAFRPINDQDDLFSYWHNTRFASGLFELPLTNGNEPPADVKHARPDEKATAEKIGRSTKFLADICKAVSKEAAVKYLDYAFIARQTLSEEQRQEPRVKAIVAAIQAGFDTMSFANMMIEDPDQLDIFDLANFVPTVDLWAQANLQGDPS